MTSHEFHSDADEIKQALELVRLKNFSYNLARIHGVPLPLEVSYGAAGANGICRPATKRNPMVPASPAARPAQIEISSRLLHMDDPRALVGGVTLHEAEHLISSSELFAWLAGNAEGGKDVQADLRMQVCEDARIERLAAVRSPGHAWMIDYKNEVTLGEGCRAGMQEKWPTMSTRSKAIFIMFHAIKYPFVLRDYEEAVCFERGGVTPFQIALHLRKKLRADDSTFETTKWAEEVFRRTIDFFEDPDQDNKDSLKDNIEKGDSVPGDPNSGDDDEETPSDNTSGDGEQKGGEGSDGQGEETPSDEGADGDADEGVPGISEEAGTPTSTQEDVRNMTECKEDAHNIEIIKEHQCKEEREKSREAQHRADGDSGTAASLKAAAETSREAAERIQKGAGGYASLSETVGTKKPPLPSNIEDLAQQFEDEKLEMRAHWVDSPEGRGKRGKKVWFREPRRKPNHAEQMKQIKAVSHKHVSRMRSAFEVRLAEVNMALRDRKKGKLDRRRLALAPTTDRLFQKNLKVEATGLSICLLMDASGSMGSTTYRGERLCMEQRSSQALQMAYVMQEALLSIPRVDLHIYAHTSFGENHRDCIVFRYYSPQRKDREALAHYDGFSQNYDHVAIRETGKEFLQNAAYEKRVMLVLSDGQPCGSGYGGEPARKAVQEETRALARKDVTVVQIAIDGANPEGMFDNYIKFKGMQSLVPEIRKVLNKMVFSAGSTITVG
jgi:hypothetical protein